MQKLMTKAEFNEWWDSDNLSGNNPYRRESAAYWAWEGYQAGVKAEREACAKTVEQAGIEGYGTIFEAAALLIRERGAP